MQSTYLVEVLVDAIVPNAQPRADAELMADGRRRFFERLITRSAEAALDYYKHYVTTAPAPLTLELRVTHRKSNPGNAWVELPTPLIFQSSVENSPAFKLARRRFAPSVPGEGEP